MSKQSKTMHKSTVLLSKVAFLLTFSVYLTVLSQGQVSGENPGSGFYPGITLESYLPPQPNAGSLGEYGQIPVSYFNGMPSVSIPIFNLIEGDIQIPHTLKLPLSRV